MWNEARGLVVVDNIAFETYYNYGREGQMKDMWGFIGSQIFANFTDSAAGVIKRIGVMMKGCYYYCANQ